MTVKHAFVSAVVDGGSTGLVRPSNWNADHTGTNEHTHGDSDNGGALPNDSITYAKIQNVSATDKVLGRMSTGAGDVEEIACTAFGRSIIDDANEATFKATVNLEIGTDVLGEISQDTTPQLGGNLDLQQFSILIPAGEPTSNVTAIGIKGTFTVDTNAEGVGAPLAMAADGHLDTADADSVDNMPCVALALETGTGTKSVLLFGVIRNDSWAWTLGAGAANLIYVSGTVGLLTQTKPVGADDVVQPVGYALSDDAIFFCPSMLWITHTG